MIRLLYIYNQLQDNIANTQNALNILHRRQARIEYLMFRLIQSQHIYSNMGENSNTEADETTNTDSQIDPSPYYATPPVSPPPPPPSLQQQPAMNTTQTNTIDSPPPPLTSIFSNIFSNVPNYLPSTTTSSVNPNYIQPTPNTPSATPNTPSATPAITNGTGPIQNRHPRLSTEYINRYSEQPINQSPEYITMYTTHPSSLSNLSSYTTTNRQPIWTPLSNSRYNEIQNNIVENILFAIMDISYNHVAEEPLTIHEINTHIKCCDFKDIPNPLNTTCPITMDVFQSDTKVMQLIHCGHIFTETDLRRWIINKRICPMCRNNITEPIL